MAVDGLGFAEALMRARLPFRLGEPSLEGGCVNLNRRFRT